MLRTGSLSCDLGYSLIELLAALTVLSLISVLAIPALRDMRGGLDARSEFSAMVDVLRASRQLALTENRPIHLLIDLDEHTYNVPGTKLKGHLSQSDKITIRTALNEVVEDHQVQLRFYPDGTSSGARIEIAQAARTSEIFVNWLTGQIRSAEK